MAWQRLVVPADAPNLKKFLGPQDPPPALDETVRFYDAHDGCMGAPMPAELVAIVKGFEGKHAKPEDLIPLFEAEIRNLGFICEEIKLYCDNISVRVRLSEYEEYPKHCWRIIRLERLNKE
jgi:hypothetical protein